MPDLLTYRGAIYPWHCDHMGHMNVMWYVGKFDEATWHLFAQIGMTPSYLRESGRGEMRDEFVSALPEYYQGRIEALQEEIAQQRKEAPVVTADEAQKNCIWFPLSLADQVLPAGSRRLFKCHVDAFGEVPASRGSVVGLLYYQLKSYEANGGTGFAIFERAAGQKHRLKLLIAVNRDEVVQYATPFVLADSTDRAWLVVPGEISTSNRDGSSLYLFKDGLPHVVEGEDAAQHLKVFSPKKH
jgi:hypothetical protein